MLHDIQPQHVQLELRFKGPLVFDSQVNLVNDLVALNINYNYPHKLVWVKDVESYYYLIDGNGSLLSHWKKFTQKVTIEQYQSNKDYYTGDIVYANGKLYQANQHINANQNPIDNGHLWNVIVGDIKSVRLMINNQSSTTIYTNIVNPFFQVIEGTFQYVNDIPVIDTDGLIKINNGEIIEAHIKRNYNLPDNNGKAYEISFWDNNAPYNFTGIINIK